jgi:polygalacturonase
MSTMDAVSVKQTGQVPQSTQTQPAPGPKCGDWLNVRQLGAVGDGVTKCTASIQRAIDQCGSSGGGTVFLPAGRYVSGTLWLRDNVTLHLESGAVLMGDSDPAAYPMWAGAWEGPGAQRRHAPRIAGEGLTNIALTGRGTIDGRGKTWWDAFNAKPGPDLRPSMVRLVDCRDVLIDGLHSINSARWALNPVACDNLTIHQVTVRNPPDSPNTDGINPDSCNNVHIANCHIDVGDDCIAIKSGSEEDGRRTLRPCQNITIMNCTMLHGHGGVVIGSEMSGGVRNVAISNCVFCGTERGIRLKARRGRGSAVEDIRVDNIVMDDVLCPIVLNLFYICGAETNSVLLDPRPQPVTARTPQFRRLRFSNITARKVKYAATFMLGLPEMSVEDIVLDGVSVYMDTTNSQAGSPAMAAGVTDMCRAGFVLHNARNVKLRGIDLYDQFGPAVVMKNSQEVLISDLCASADKDPLIVVDGKAATVSEERDDAGGGLMAGEDGQRARIFTRGWRYGRRRTSRAGTDAALSKLAAESPDLT